MHAATDRLEFAPPATPGLPRALLLAVLVHGLLLVGLSLGVQWKRDAQVVSADAELWSAVPHEAAPKLVEPPPEPPAPPAPVKPTPRAPEPTPVEAAPPPKLPEVDIALQQEKLRLKKQHERELAKQAALRLEKLAEQKHLQDKQRQDKLKQDKLKAEKLKQEQLHAEKLKQEQADKVEKAALEKKKSAVEAKQLEAQRVKNLQRIAGMAGASGGPNAAGTALKSSGPSASYAGRIRARVKPNIIFTEEAQGNPVAEVEVRTSPDGTIISRKISKSSGLKSWDDAVLKALDRTEMLPRDTDGTVPSSLTLIFRPKD